MKTIWLLIQENALPEHGMLNRHALFAKYLLRLGYRPIVIVASATRCSSKQMITDDSPYLVDDSHGYPFIYIRVNDFRDSMKRRLLAIAEYHMRLAKNANKIASEFGVPDVILGSSNYPITPTLAHVLAKRFKAKSICEIRDLWPLSLEEYGIISRGGLIARLMYVLEKKNYRDADAVIFTMAGGADYIAEKGWDLQSGGDIDLRKVRHINNGVDLEDFDNNLNNKPFTHPAFEQDGRFKLVYAGSVRKANGLAFLVDVAEQLADDPVDLVIIGDGVERSELESDAANRGLTNIYFVGPVNKELIPSALSQGMMMMMMYSRSQHALSKYGMSQNKLFEYLASGKPVISNLPSNYSVVNEKSCGIERDFATPEDCACVIREMLSSPDDIVAWGENSRRTAYEYSYEKHAEKLAEIIEELTENDKR